MCADDQAVRLCPYCEGPIHRPKGKTCGDVACQTQHHREGARRSYQRRRAAGGPRRVGPRETRSCAWCGEGFDEFISETRRRYCSRGCSNKARFPKPVEVYTRPAYGPVHVVGKTRWFSCACRVCGATFTHTMPHYTCTPECFEELRRRGRQGVYARRRARLRGATTELFSRADVFERDGYLCYICDRPTRRGEAVPHHLAPTIDHVIPLARGGHHSLANCKTAHFICNSTKGDRVGYVPPAGASPLRLGLAAVGVGGHRVPGVL